jgi:hypothetical protein
METIKVYKLFRQEADGLHPLFIDADMVLPIGQWIEARAPDDISIQYVGTGFALIDLQRQRPLIMQDRRPRRNQVTKATHDGCRWVEVEQGKHGRNVYDIGIGSTGQVLRFAHRPGWHTSAQPSLPSVDMTGKVWAECQIPADDYYILHRNISGLSRGHEAVDWYISEKLLIVTTMPQPNT